MHTSFQLDGSDGGVRDCYRWSTDGPPRGVVVLAHGMGEHALRYARLAGALAERGLETFALDHRGHGPTAAHAGQLGVLGLAGWNPVVDDYALLVRNARSQRPGVPVVALGHSMGSFVVQQFLLDHSAEVVAAVLSGSAALDEVRAIIDPTVPMDLSVLNAPFAPARTNYDWLSRDEAEVDAYIADPLCGVGLDAAGMSSLLSVTDRLADPTEIAACAGFPIALVAGGDDPVNAGYAWLDTLAARYEAAGAEVTKMYYDGARHEVFNEINRDEITFALVEWLEGILLRASTSSAPASG